MDAESKLSLDLKRPVAEPAAAAGAAPPAPRRLAEGPARPAMVCFVSTLAGADPYQYACLAAEHRGVRDVWVLTLPGYTAEERLPDSLTTLIGAQVDAVKRCAAPSDAVLVGHSSGGLIAHAVAHALEAEASPSAGLILIDTHVRAAAGTGAALQHALGETTTLPNDDNALTAMGAYLRLFASWSPKPIRTPILVVRPSHPLASAAELLEDVRGHTGGGSRRTTAVVPGDHFSMIREHADTTARIVEQWITRRRRTRLPVPRSRGAGPAAEAVAGHRISGER